MEKLKESQIRQIIKPLNWQQARGGWKAEVNIGYVMHRFFIQENAGRFYTSVWFDDYLLANLPTCNTFKEAKHEVLKHYQDTVIRSLNAEPTPAKLCIVGCHFDVNPYTQEILNISEVDANFFIDISIRSLQIKSDPLPVYYQMPEAIYILGKEYNAVRIYDDDGDFEMKFMRWADLISD